MKPERDGDVDEVEQLNDLLSEDNVHVLPLTRRMARHATAIRARHQLSTTEAIIIATAEEAGCDVILGNDRQWRGRTSIPYVYLDEALADS